MIEQKIREEAGLTQEELANALKVSTILISMIESESRAPSKIFIANLAQKLGVRTGSLLPFISSTDDSDIKTISSIEKSLIKLGEKFQMHLIRSKAKQLKKYVKK